MDHPQNYFSEQPQMGASPAFWSVFALAFVVLFVAAISACAVGMQWRSLLPGAENSKGFVEGVSGAVYTFMSHIS